MTERSSRWKNAKPPYQRFVEQVPNETRDEDDEYRDVCWNGVESDSS